MICSVCKKNFNASHEVRDLNNNTYCSIECLVKKVTRNEQ